MEDNTSDQKEVQLSTKPQQRDATPEPTAKQRKLASWLKEASSTSTSTSQDSSKRIKEEMDSYEKIPKPDADSSPLKWWIT